MDWTEFETGVARQAAAADAQLRQDLLSKVVMPNLALLRGGNCVRWSEPGWYTAVGTHAMHSQRIPLPVGVEAFPVPADCGFWHQPERDPRDGIWFRFFYREAWLDLDLPATGELELTVHYAVHPEAVDRLAVWIDGQELQCLQRDADDCSRTRLRLALPESFDTAVRRRVVFSTPVTWVPAEALPGSHDVRLLSLAVSQPRPLDPQRSACA